MFKSVSFQKQLEFVLDDQIHFAEDIQDKLVNTIKLLTLLSGYLLSLFHGITNSRFY